MISYNTRIAPSPTGYFHLGTARTAYFNYLVARATGGQFILRIDDTDTSRNNEAYYNCILDTFNWLDLKFDQLHYQSKRLDFYYDVIGKLINLDRATTLADGAVVLKTLNLPTHWTDSIAGDLKINADDIKNATNLVLLKSDGMPTYNFASIVDDIDLNVNWIIRGIDHLKNTPKQIAVIAALDGILPIHDIKFTHVGLIHHLKDGKMVKMSKRDGALGVLDYRDNGYSNDAFLNHILKLGWSISDPLFDQKFKTVSKAQATDLILQGKFRSVSATHDIKKLDNLNKLWNKIEKMAD
jgi:glutamyl-tRNA synthetase